MVDLFRPYDELIENTKIFVENKTLVAETYGEKFHEVGQANNSLDLFRLIVYLYLARESSTVILRDINGFEKEQILGDREQLRGFRIAEKRKMLYIIDDKSLLPPPIHSAKEFIWSGKYHPVKNFKILEES